jgi:hypothetical protein
MRKRTVASDTLAKIKDRLGEAGIKWAIFAGAAACCYGSKREITDVDILVRSEDLEKAKTVLRGVNLKGFDIVADGEIKTSQGTHPFILDDKMRERLSWKQLLSIDVPVLSIEDNIVFKAILQRGKESEKHDVEDIQAMVSNAKINVKYLAERVRKFHAERRVNPLLRSVIPDLP